MGYDRVPEISISEHSLISFARPLLALVDLVS